MAGHATTGRRGYAGNALGLSFGECLMVNDMRHDMVEALNHHMARGMTFGQAQERVIADAMKVSTYSTEPVREGYRRVGAAMDYTDISPENRRRMKDDLRKAIEEHRGKPMGRIERVFYNLTGMAF